jgi:hypothetical protein
MYQVPAENQQPMGNRGTLAMESSVRYAGMFANLPFAAAAEAQFGDVTLEVFLNPRFTSPRANAIRAHQARAVQEALHNVTGMVDGSSPNGRESREKCF